MAHIKDIYEKLTASGINPDRIDFKVLFKSKFHGMIVLTSGQIGYQVYIPDEGDFYFSSFQQALDHIKCHTYE